MPPVNQQGLQEALQGAARSLLASPRVVIAIAALASASGANAQWFGGGDYERAGSSIGYELGRSVSSSRTQGIATVMTQTLLGQAGRMLDGRKKEEEQAQLAAQQAAAQASADAAYRSAYDAERRRIDPNYVPGSDGYPAIARRGAASTQQWGAVSGLSGVDAQLSALQREWQLRNEYAGGDSNVQVPRN